MEANGTSQAITASLSISEQIIPSPIPSQAASVNIQSPHLDPDDAVDASPALNSLGNHQGLELEIPSASKNQTISTNHNTSLPQVYSPGDGPRPRLIIRLALKNQTTNDDVGRNTEPLSSLDNKKVTKKAWNLRQHKRKTARLICEDSSEEKMVSNKFSIALSREEIEDDLLLVMGKKKHPSRSRRASKRSEKQQIDRLFPGSCFCSNSITRPRKI